VQEAGAGLVVAPEPRAIAEALEQILIEDTLRREMGVRGKAFAEREYSMPVMARRLVALYEEIRSPRERHAA
jgi:glycosyltransferase involved in cell wall biosynthesis